MVEKKFQREDIYLVLENGEKQGSASKKRRRERCKKKLYIVLVKDIIENIIFGRRRIDYICENNLCELLICIQQQTLTYEHKCSLHYLLLTKEF